MEKLQRLVWQKSSSPVKLSQAQK